MSDLRTILPKAFRSGYAWSAETPDLWDLRAEHLDTLGDRDALRIINVWRRSDSNFARLMFREHGRRQMLDDSIGPATQALAGLTRCPMPDFAPPPATDLSMYGGMAQAVQAMRDNATGSGSWPDCDAGRETVGSGHSITVNVATAGMPYSFPFFRSFIAIAIEAAGRMGLSARYILDGDPKAAEISVLFAALEEADPNAQTIGWQEFPQPGTCNQVLNGRITTRWNPSNPYHHARLWFHEQLGHGVGLRHKPWGLLNPTIELHDSLEIAGDPIESEYRQWFGGEPVTAKPTTPDPPPVPPAPTSPDLSALVEALKSDPEFLILVRGPRGEQGVTGPRGPAGERGPAGTGGIPPAAIASLEAIYRELQASGGLFGWSRFASSAGPELRKLIEALNPNPKEAR